MSAPKITLRGSAHDRINGREYEVPYGCTAIHIPIYGADNRLSFEVFDTTTGELIRSYDGRGTND